MTQLRIPDNTKITTKISSLLNNISHSFLLYLICFLFFCKIASLGVNAQQNEQVDSDRTIAIPLMNWINFGSLKGTPPPGLKDFAFGYSSNIAIIFGGTTLSGSKSGVTYILDLNDNTWKTLSDYGFLNPIVPEARSHMIFGVDKSSSYRNAFIISCGQGSGGVLYNDIWAFDFIYKQWTKVTRVTGAIPPPMYGSIGGIDTTLATSSQIIETNTLWASHGTNGTHFFTDLYALVTTGNLSPNLVSLSATWYKIPVVSGSVIPPGRSSVSGTILPNKKLALYGGCDRIEGKCATSDTYALNLGSNYSYGDVNSATPLWSKKNSCLGARSGAAMVMNSNPTLTFPNQAIVYGGSSSDASDGKLVGEPGEIGVLDADLGNWVRVLPPKDPNAGYPPQRTGAQMVPLPLTIGTPGGTATDILLFGGADKDGNNLNDLWILRLNNSFVSGDIAKNTNSQIAFLKCIPEPKNGTVIKPGTGTNTETGDSKSNGDDDYFGSLTTLKSHVTFSTISFACLPLAASVIRFGYGSDQKWVIAGLYIILIVASYATAFYGFAIAFQDRQKLSGHFKTRHGSLGLVLLILLYIIVPLMAIVSLFASKKYESDSISDDDSDNEKGRTRSKLTDFFNWRSSESNSKTAKSFEVSRPGNSSQPPPLKSSDNWTEKRKSVTTHPTMSSQGSSLQYVPSSRRTSQSTAVSRSGLQTPSNTSVVIIIRRVHHVIAQIVLILTVIYIGTSLIRMKVVDSIYFYIFVVFMVIIYLIWLVAARYGYPKGRNSLLVLFMHKVACGKGEINERKQYDFEEDYRSGRNSATPALSSNRMRIEDDEMDEEAEQAQLEQDMHNREVVVMTIPKRRLTVVNA